MFNPHPPIVRTEDGGPGTCYGGLKIPGQSGRDRQWAVVSG